MKDREYTKEDYIKGITVLDRSLQNTEYKVEKDNGKTKKQKRIRTEK